MSALPKYKDIVDLIKKGATFEAQEKIMELREACMTLEDEVHTLKKNSKELEEALKFKDELQFKAPFYFLPDDSEPFCPRCWESERKAIHLSPEIVSQYDYVRPCPECKEKYKTRSVDFGGGIV